MSGAIPMYAAKRPSTAKTLYSLTFHGSGHTTSSARVMIIPQSNPIDARVFIFGRTLKMSRDLGWREPCSSTDRDS